MDLAGRRCLVSGCSSGIGRALAIALADAGATVIATARNPEAIVGIRSPRIETTALDVIDLGSVTAAVALAEPVDVLINNAGYGLIGAVEEIADDELLDQYQTNVFGPWRMCRAVLPGMRSRGAGVIVNISSVGGQAPFPGIGAYRTSKFALEGLSWTLYFEVAHFGIRVLDVQPGLVASDFGTRSLKTARAASPNAVYRQMRDIADAAYPRMSPEAMSPAFVADQIIDELRKDRGPLRLRIGADAQRVLAAAQKSDEAYERFLVDELGFHWHPR
jgi:NAD(P)-dependent dehydrogenase (short-subunit alcohol dehydrogenase family)